MDDKTKKSRHVEERTRPRKNPNPEKALNPNEKPDPLADNIRPEDQSAG